MLEELNKAQREAVETVDGPVMVMAGAGSGKTRVLTMRIAYIIQQQLAYPSNILAVTFTNKAANEMKERVAKILNLDTHLMWISTFHSFCARLLRLEVDKGLPPYTHNFLIADEEDSTKIVRDVMKKLDIDSHKAKYFKNLISKSKNFSTFKIHDFSIESEYLKIRKAYEDYLKTNNMLDFDDLIIKTIELFKNNPMILEKYQSKFKYIMIDEFQDTNELQYALMSMLAARFHNIFVVGDDFQSIYSFRGACIGNIKKFQSDYPEHKLIILEENYRSTTQILNVANEVIKNNPNQIKKVMFSSKKTGKQPFYYEASDARSEAMYVIDKVKQLYLDGYSYSDMAIMYRVNYISRIFEDMLIRYRIPYRVYGGISFFSRKEIKDVVAYLRIIINPDDNFSFLRIINEPKRKIGGVLLEKLTIWAESQNLSLFNAIESFQASGQGFKNLKDFKLMVDSIRAQIENIYLHNLVDVLMEATGYEEMLKAEDAEGERIANIFEFKNILKETGESLFGTNKEKLESILADLALKTDADEQSTDDCLVLTTYHQAKGLEFKNVFMVANEEGILPSGIEDTEIEEERRICYVGITRAMDNLYVTNARQRLMYGELSNQAQSRFIKEMGIDYFKTSALSNSKSEVFKRQLDKEKSGDDLKVGDKIEHQVFGRGLVVSVDDRSIRVAFPAPMGIKTLLKGHPSYFKL